MIHVRKISFTLAIAALVFLLIGCGGPAEGSGTEAVPNGESQQEENLETDKNDELGTRANPVPIETEVKVGPNWNIAILEIVPDAWSIVKEENQFNDPPEEGNQFVMAKIRVSYVGEESDTPWTSLNIRYLGNDGNTYDSGIGVLPKPFIDIGEQFPGASADANIGWEVPVDSLVDGTIIIEESFSFEDTRVFFEGVR